MRAQIPKVPRDLIYNRHHYHYCYYYYHYYF